MPRSFDPRARNKNKTKKWCGHCNNTSKEHTIILCTCGVRYCPFHVDKHAAHAPGPVTVKQT